MNQTTTLRCPSSAAEFLASEAVRQSRPLVQIVGAAARALESFAPRDREAFILGEEMTNADRKAVGLSPLPPLARSLGARNRRKGGAR